LNDSQWLSSSSALLAIWLIVLAIGVVFAWVIAIFPNAFGKARPVLFAVSAVPILAVLVLFAVRGFTPAERPIVHWIFDRESPSALRFGAMLDPLAWIASFSFATALYGTTIRNRPNVRVVAAAMGAWIGLSLVASSKTAWTAFLGIAIQLVSSVLPLLPSGESGSVQNHALADDRWVAATKRNWIAVACSLAGATALVTLGIHLDFSPEQPWSKLEENYASAIAAGLFLLGLVLLLTPAFSARAMQGDVSTEDLDASEERQFIFEGSIGWSAAIILYRLQESMKDTHWPLAISIAAAVVALLSLPSLVFHERRRNAAVQWIATLPALAGAILPLLPPAEAFFFLGSLLPISAALTVCFERPRTKTGIWVSGFFVLGACGLVGWSSSAGITHFYSRIEETPALQGSIALLWLLFCAIGWRIVLRGKSDEKDAAPLAVGVSLGVLALLAFGPALSGRWSGGSLPEALDWIANAKSWPWLERFADSPDGMNWTGFALSQAVWFVGILLGSFAWRSAALFPFPEKGGRGKEVTSGLFGAFWLAERGGLFLEGIGRVWAEKVSAPFWERLLPVAIGTIARSFARTGSLFERLADPLTSGIYGSTVRAPAKFVRWLHGGNARLYGWFALIWILIFSLYLTRS
jgi:hypothetical protein